MFIWLECWKYKPNERPDIQEVVLILKMIISGKINDDSENEIKEKLDDIVSINSSDLFISKLMQDHN